MSLTLVVVGKDFKSLEEWNNFYLPDGVTLVLRANLEKASMASLGNYYLEASTTDVWGMCHADCSFEEGALQKFTEIAMDGFVTGIVGRDPGKGNRWCNCEKDVPGAVWTLRPGPVSVLDSCSVFFRKDLGLQFDEVVFDGFHCYVEDLCLQAQSRGIPSIVPAALASHRGDTFMDPQWQASYRLYRQKLGVKWSGVHFETT